MNYNVLAAIACSLLYLAAFFFFVSGTYHNLYPPITFVVLDEKYADCLLDEDNWKTLLIHAKEA